ncbi:hypothetical protein HJFPF1_10552 [Paramyrothecium foliicola]|nr:hypothetical protein HJFPF1_10552 [Paramyrothecium foliicola]
MRTPSWATFGGILQGDNGIEVVLLHTFKARAFDYARTRLERSISQAVKNVEKTSTRLHFFRHDAEEIIRRGEEGYLATFKKLKLKVDENLKQGSPILFIGCELSSWLVRDFLVELARNDPQRFDTVKAVIFMGANSSGAKAHFSYSAYMDKWLPSDSPASSRNSSFHDSTPIEPSTISNENSKRLLDDLKKKFLLIDENFATLAEEEQGRAIRENTWRIPTTATFAEPTRKHRSKFSELRFRGISNSVRRTYSTGEHEQQPTSDVDCRIVEHLSRSINTSSSRIDSNDTQIIEADHIEHGAERFFEQRKSQADDKPHLDTYERQEELRDSLPSFSESHQLDPSHRNRLLTLKRDAKAPPVFIHTPQNPRDNLSIPEHEWLSQSQAAQLYLDRGQLENADVLYNWCIQTGASSVFSDTDVLLRSRMQRSVIQILRGRYGEATGDLQGVKNECLGRIKQIRRFQQDNDIYGSFRLRPSQTSTRTKATESDSRSENLAYNFFILLIEVSYHLAAAFMRQGHFKLSYNELEFPYIWLLDSTSDITMTSVYGGLEYPDELRLFIGVTRLWSLLHAYLGDFSQARTSMSQAEDLFAFLEQHDRKDQDGVMSGPPTPQLASQENNSTMGTNTPMHGSASRNPTRSIRLVLDLSITKLYLLSGQFSEALDSARSCSTAMEEHLGVSHLLTLESRYVKAMVLAQTGILDEARSFCMETKHLMNRYLTKDHPFFFEITHVLVMLARLEARSFEALTTSTNLCTRARNLLGEKTQQTLRFEFQLASLRLWAGTYKDAQRQLENLLNHTSALGWESSHPWVMRAQTELALCYNLQGKVKESKDIIDDVLRLQAAAVGVKETNSPSLSFLLLDLLERLKDCIEGANTNNAGASLNSVHPDLLYTLDVYTRNECAMTKANKNLIIQLRRIIYGFRKSSKSFGSSHLLTIQAAVDLANVLRQDAEESSRDEAKEIYETVVNNLSKFDPKHPLKLSAEQGLWQLRARNNSAKSGEDDLLVHVMGVLQNFCERLGKQNPEALRAQLTTFAFVSFINKDHAAEISDELLSHLQDSQVRAQRRAECMQLEERLALVHFSLQNLDKAMTIFKVLMSELTSRDDDVGELLSHRPEMEGRIYQEVSMVREACEKELDIGRKQAKSALKNKDYEGAVVKLRKAANLAAALYGDPTDKAEDVRLQLAKALWKQGVETSPMPTDPVIRTKTMSEKDSQGTTRQDGSTTLRATSPKGRLEQAQQDCSAWLVATFTPPAETATAYLTVSSTETIVDEVTITNSVYDTFTSTVRETPTETVYTSTTTVTAGTITVERRAASATIPVYASPCSGAVRYSSACSCIGVSAAPSTVTLPASTVTVTEPTAVLATVYETSAVATSVTTIYEETITETITEPAVTVSTVSTVTTTEIASPTTTFTVSMQLAERGPGYMGKLDINSGATYGTWTSDASAAISLTLRPDGTLWYGNKVLKGDSSAFLLALFFIDPSLTTVNRRTHTCRINSDDTLACALGDAEVKFLAQPGQVTPILYSGKVVNINPNYREVVFKVKRS